jgi:tight adherence protein C
MPVLITFLFGLAVAGIILTVAVGLFSRWQTETAEEERLYFSSMAPTLEEVELELPFRERVIDPAISSLLSFLGRFAPQQNLQDLQHRLEVAGRPYGWTVVDFLGIRILAGILTAAIFFLLLGFGDTSTLVRVGLTLVMAVLGYYLPILWLRARIRGRQSELMRALPDGLDMLNICVGAGLGFDAALTRIGERWKTALADEFNRVVIEIRLGKTRAKALTDLAERTEVPEIENFVATIVQADQLGVSIAKVLRAQAEQMRIIRRQRAEEQARQATIKLLFPLVFLIFPALLAVLLGPAIPQIINTFSSL